MLITLDGPAGVGKTTLAKKLAEKLQIAYLDSGAMFRGLAYYLGQDKLNLSEEELKPILNNFQFQLVLEGKGYFLYLNQKKLGEEIRTEEVGFLASSLGKLKVVRDFLKAEQQRLAENTSLVAEGRDMGTVVFPQADYKFFLDADCEERAKRRYKQLKMLGKEADLTLILEQIKQRDEQDRNRPIAPLKPAADAIIIDTTKLNLEEVFFKILSYIK
ncbi:MAG: CMP/dCMP kinase [Desulfonauticus sp.]|nr:CMP/dCMP kinase [Desulfonauticus sp.]